MGIMYEQLLIWRNNLIDTTVIQIKMVVTADRKLIDRIIRAVDYIGLGKGSL